MAPATMWRPLFVRLGRLLLWGSLGLGCGLVALVLYAHSDHAAERLRGMLIELGSEQLGEDLYVRELSIQRVLPPTVRLAEITIHTAEGQPLIRVQELQASLESVPLPWKRIVPIASLQAVEPSIRIALVDGQPRDFEQLIDRLSQPRSPRANPWKVQLGTLAVDDASARVTVEPPGLGLALRDVDLAFSQDDLGNGAGTLGADSIELVVGEFEENAVLEPVNFTVEAGVVTLDGGALELSSGRLEIEGVVGLPDPPGAPQARPLTYGLTARAGFDLPELRSAWPRLPEIEGSLDAAIGLSGQGLEPLVTFNLQGQDIAVHLTKPRPMVFKAESPSIIGHFRDMAVIIEEESALRWGGGVIKPEGRVDLRGSMPFELQAELRELRLEQVLDSATVPGSWVTMGVSGEASLAGTIAGGFQGRGRGQLQASDMRVHDRAWDSEGPRTEMLRVPTATVDTAIYVDSRHCLLEPATIRGPETELEASIDFLFLKPLGLIIDVDSQRFSMADLQDRVAGVHIEGQGGVKARVEGPTKDLDISGSVELEDFVLTKWPFGRVAGDVHWHTRQDLSFTALRGRRGASDFEAEVRLMFANVRRGGDRDKLELSIDAMVPEGHGRAEDILPIFFGDSIDARGVAWGGASLHGPTQGLSGDAWVQARDVDYLWERFESVEARARVEGGRLTVEEGWARKGPGEAIFARGSLDRGGEVEFEFRLPRMQLDSLEPVRKLFPAGRSSSLVELAGGGGPWVSGVVSGNVVLSGTLANLGLSGRLDLANLVYRGTSLGDTWVQVELSDHVLTAKGRAMNDRLRLGARLGTNGLWDYAYGVRWTGFDLTPFLPRTVLTQKEPVTAGMSGGLEGTGTLRDSFHDVELELSELFLERGGHRIEGRLDRPVVLGYSGGALRFEQLELVSPVGGAGTTDLRVEGWLRPDGPLDVQIIGTVDIAFADLAYDVFDRAEASALVVDMGISGFSTSAVDIEGEAVLKQAFLKTIYWPHPFEVDLAVVRLSEGRLTLEEFEGSMGGGRLENLAGSYIELDRTGYRPRTYALRADCIGCTVRYPSFMPPARGTARLQFLGTAPDDLVLRGRVQVEEMVLRETLNWQRSVLTFRRRFTETLAQAEQAGLFELDLSFEAEPGALGLDNNIGNLVGSASDFRVLGDTNHVTLQGTVRIEGGSIEAMGHNFEVEPSLARFRDRESWFPELELGMETEVLNRDETYRIRYDLSGPLDSLQIRPSSEPSLSEADINLILLFGLTQEQLAEAELSDVLLVGAGAAGGTYGETAAMSLGQAVGLAGAADILIPDHIEIVPVYTDTTGGTHVWAVATEQLPPPFDPVTLEFGVGLGLGQNVAVPTAFRAQLRFRRDIYLEGSWIRDDAASRAYGNFGIDIKFEAGID